MRKKRNFGLSRLKMAWLAVFLLLGAGVIFTWALPEKEVEPDLAIDLPATPERFASGPGEEEPILLAESVDKTSATEAIASQQVAQASSISTPAGEVGLPATKEEELPDGTLRITIPQSTPASSSSVSTMTKSAIAALVGDGEFGPSPQMGANGKSPFATYRRSVTTTGSPEVGIMLSGLGLDPQLTELAIESLPAEISFSFAPYAKDVSALMQKAMADGHEVAIELPMEEPGVSPDALGPAGLTIARRGEGNARRLEWLFARSPAYPMVTNYLGGSFGQDQEAISQIMAALSARGLGYIDDTGLGAEAAAEFGVPYGRVNVVVPRGSGLARQGLEQLKGAASNGRPVLGRLYISPEAINAIEGWAEDLEKEGVILVPASAVVKSSS